MSRPNSYLRRRDHRLASSVMFDSLCLEQHSTRHCRKAAPAPKVTSSGKTAESIHNAQFRSCGLQEKLLAEKTTKASNTAKVTCKPSCKLIDESPASTVLFDCLGLESGRSYRAGLKQQLQPRSMAFNPRSMVKTLSLIGAHSSNTSTMDTLPLAPGALNSLVKNYSLPREAEDHSSSGSQSDGSTSTCNEASDCEMLG